jgi:hypothetical protein
MNHPIALSVAFLVFANSALATESNSLLSTEGPLALKQTQAPELFKQCSRRAPKPQTRLWFPILWEPTAANVKALETQLEKYISTVDSSISGAPAKGQLYRGQYAGFMRGDVRYIYAAYVPARIAVSLKDAVPSGNAIQFCDGGNHFWGIVYNTATGQFSELEVNGR